MDEPITLIHQHYDAGVSSSAGCFVSALLDDEHKQIKTVGTARDFKTMVVTLYQQQPGSYLIYSHSAVGVNKVLLL
jgi:hypothetical protein